MILNQTGFMQPNLAPQETIPSEKDVSLPADPLEQSNQGHIFLKAEQGLIYVHLPPNKAMTGDWHQLREQLQHRLDASQKRWPPNTVTYLVANDRLLDHRQLEQLDAALSEANLRLKRVFTSRRQTAIAAVTAGYSVDQQSPTLPLAAPSVAPSPIASVPIPTTVEPLYLQTTLRSGGEVRHPGSVVIVGDVNPGSTIVADGSILVWGRLRGIAHAGASGDRKGQIMALQMEPTQLRIADQVARAPAKAPTQFYPEVAYIGFEGIRITRASEFAKQKSAS
jgi:septum site-determining protein MinC